jgi:hypothetical protein
MTGQQKKQLNMNSVMDEKCFIYIYLCIYTDNICVCVYYRKVKKGKERQKKKDSRTHASTPRTRRQAGFSNFAP